MARLVKEERIEASPEQVHGFIQDFDRYPEWIPFTDEVTRVDYAKEGMVGTRYYEQGTGGESSWEVIAFEEGEREIHEGDIGIARVRIEMFMEPEDEATAYTHVIEYEMKPPVIGWLIDKLVLGRRMRDGLEETVANLKRIVENEAA